MRVLKTLLLGALAALTKAELASVPGLSLPSPGDILSAAKIIDCLTRLASATTSLSASAAFPGVYPEMQVSPELIESNTTAFQLVFTQHYCATVVDLLTNVAAVSEQRESTNDQGPTRRRDAVRRLMVELDGDVDPDNTEFLPSPGGGYDRFTVGACVCPPTRLLNLTHTHSPSPYFSFLFPAW